MKNINNKKTVANAKLENNKNYNSATASYAVVTKNSTMTKKERMASKYSQKTSIKGNKRDDRSLNTSINESPLIASVNKARTHSNVNASRYANRTVDTPISKSKRQFLNWRSL